MTGNPAGAGSPAERAATRTLRTAYRRAEDDDARGGPDPRVVNAALLCRDQVLGSVDGRSTARTLRLLRGSLDGLGQHELAAQEGISASAVSQRFRRDGLGAVLAAEELMRGI